jgi:hypothetical protein
MSSYLLHVSSTALSNSKRDLDYHPGHLASPNSIPMATIRGFYGAGIACLLPHIES